MGAHNEKRVLHRSTFHYSYYISGFDVVVQPRPEINGNHRWNQRKPPVKSMDTTGGINGKLFIQQGKEENDRRLIKKEK
jgi:hypothetical protein